MLQCEWPQCGRHSCSCEVCGWATLDDGLMEKGSHVRMACITLLFLCLVDFPSPPPFLMRWCILHRVWCPQLDDDDIEEDLGRREELEEEDEEVPEANTPSNEDEEEDGEEEDNDDE